MTNAPTQQWQQQPSSNKGPGNTTILNGPGDHPNTGAQDSPTSTANSTPQGAAPPALQAPPLTRGPPQAPPVNNQDAATGGECPTHPQQQQNQNTGQNHQGLPDHNGSTSTPKDAGKGPRPQKGKKKSSEPHPGMSTGTEYTSQDTGPSRHQIQCSACGEYSHWSKDCPYYNFCDVCKVTTHSTHMCRASKCSDPPPRSPVCIYCGKANHRSVNCRYLPWDNCEEPRTTPDALRTGTNGENSALVPRNQAGSAHPGTTNQVPFSQYGGQNGQPNRGQPSAQSRGQQATNQGFSHRGQQHMHFNEQYNRRYSPYFSVSCFQ